MKTQTAHHPGAVLPNKLFYRINEVARITGVKPYVLRYWESEFPELAPEKDGSDQRRYRNKDIDTVLAIRKLLYEDRYTIEGARRQLKREPGRAEAPRPMAEADPRGRRAPLAGPEQCAVLHEKLDLLRGEITEILAILSH